MIVVLPIHPDYHKESNPYSYLAQRFPYGLAGLAYYVVLSGYDLQNFITDCTEHLITDYSNEEYDSGLDRYNDEKFTAAVMSSGFNLYLQLFYETHAALYRTLMPDIRPLDLNLHHQSGNKLILQMDNYEYI